MPAIKKTERRKSDAELFHHKQDAISLKYSRRHSLRQQESIDRIARYFDQQQHNESINENEAKLLVSIEHEETTIESQTLETVVKSSLLLVEVHDTDETIATKPEKRSSLRQRCEEIDKEPNIDNLQVLVK